MRKCSDDSIAEEVHRTQSSEFVFQAYGLESELPNLRPKSATDGRSDEALMRFARNAAVDTPERVRFLTKISETYSVFLLCDEGTSEDIVERQAMASITIQRALKTGRSILIQYAMPSKVRDRSTVPVFYAGVPTELDLDLGLLTLTNLDWDAPKMFHLEHIEATRELPSVEGDRVITFFYTVCSKSDALFSPMTVSLVLEYDGPVPFTARSLDEPRTYEAVRANWMNPNEALERVKNARLYREKGIVSRGDLIEVTLEDGTVVTAQVRNILSKASETH